jgi:hypothetical protein
MAILGEDLHARTFVPTIANDIFAGVSHDRNFSRVPQLAFLLARNAKLELEGARLLKDLQRNV